MADRIGVIDGGRIILVENKDALMSKLGEKELHLHLQTPMTVLPAALSAYALNLREDGNTLVYTFDPKGERTGATRLLSDLADLGIRFTDMDTRQSSLEDIFVSLVEKSQ